jgi:glycosyltransferase involved in cell wall biosynthesis
MDEKLKILAPVRYPWRFNSPRTSRHDISVRYFAPLNKISRKIEGLTVFNPFPLRKFDLVHGFNRIPVGVTPFVIGFESHLPRAFDLENTKYFATLSHMLGGKRCRGIVAISDFARRQFLQQHANRPWHDDVAAKLTMRYPNIPIPDMQDAVVSYDGGPLRLMFVGNHFGRKGGTVVVRLAELAHQKGFPLHIDLVSTLEAGAMSWIDPLADGYFEKYFITMRRLPNIACHSNLPNARVIALVRNAHFSILPTFSDTFGFSVIEAMAQHTPVIVTHQGALPEFVTDGAEGIVLPLENNAAGEWKHNGRNDRHTQAYAALFDAETDRLAHAALASLEAIANNPQGYAQMRKNARTRAQGLFAATDANVFWDDYYAKAVRTP